MKRFYPIVTLETVQLFCDPSLVPAVPISSDDARITAPIQFGWNYSLEEVCQLTPEDRSDIASIGLAAVYFHLEGTGVLKFNADYMAPMPFHSNQALPNLLTLSGVQKVHLGQAEIFGSLDSSMDPSWEITFHLTGTIDESDLMVNFSAVFPVLKNAAGEKVDLYMVGYDLAVLGKPERPAAREDYLYITIAGPTNCGRTAVARELVTRVLTYHGFTNVDTTHAGGVGDFDNFDGVPIPAEIREQKVVVLNIDTERPAKFLTE